MPSSSVGRIMRQPFIKFICHSVSYIFFLSTFANTWTRAGEPPMDRPCLSILVLLFVVSLRIDFGKLLTGIEEEASERRGPPPNPVEFAVRGRPDVSLTHYRRDCLDHDLRRWLHLGRDQATVPGGSTSVHGRKRALPSFDSI